MKNLGLLANVVVAVAAVLCVLVFAFDRLSTVSAQRVNDVKWEHCYVVYDSAVTKGNIERYEGTATISYLSPGSLRIERVKSSSDDEDPTVASRNALSQAVSKLGLLGWKLAAVGTSIGPNGEPALYFKRQQK